MSDKELENFIFKFRQLRKAGYTAHLDIDAYAGRSWIGLRVMLDPVQQQNQSKPGKHRSPSYFRRQEKRKLAKSSAAASKKDDTVKVPTAAAATADLVDNAEEAIILDHTQQADNDDRHLNVSRMKDAGEASGAATAVNDVGLNINSVNSSGDDENLEGADSNCSFPTENSNVDNKNDEVATTSNGRLIIPVGTVKFVTLDVRRRLA